MSSLPPGVALVGTSESFDRRAGTSDVSVALGEARGSQALAGRA